MVDISSIIVNWNTRDLLLQTIVSLKDQATRFSTEIIVVDNGSTDGSQAATAAAFPDVAVIDTGANLGFSRANNIGICRARGRYICLVNSDTKALPGSIDAMGAYMESHPECGILGPKTLNGDMSLRVNCRTFPTLWNLLCGAFCLHRLFPRSRILGENLMRHFGHDIVRDVDILPGCFLMIRREALDAVGLLDERFFIYGEDKDLCRRFRDAGWKVTFCPDAKVIHYAKGSSSKAPARFLVEKLRANRQYWEKHHGAAGAFFFVLVMLLHHLLRLPGGALRLLGGQAAREAARRRIGASLRCIRWLLARLAGKDLPLGAQDTP